MELKSETLAHAANKKTVFYLRGYKEGSATLSNVKCGVTAHKNGKVLGALVHHAKDLEMGGVGI